VTQGAFGDPLVLEIKHDSQGGVNAVHLFETETTQAVAESTRIDCRGLFGQHPCDLAVDLDFGSKAGSAS
jgi:hypothetical protein